MTIMDWDIVFTSYSVDLKIKENSTNLICADL
jgi:hypothetical protein